MTSKRGYPWPNWGWAAAIGGVGAALWAIGWAVDPASRVLGAWLAAFVFWLGLPLGALGIMMIHDLAGGAWGDVLRRPLASIAAILPIFALLAIPILVGLPALYPWARGDGSATPSTPANAWYLNPVFFVVRTVIYFAIWIALEFMVRRPRGSGRGVRIAVPGVILFALTVTFASVDWLSSLDPRFSSSAYGMMVGAGILLSGLAAAVLIAVRHVSDPRALASCGNLLMTGILAWAYIVFMQFLIVWEENLTDEIPWYLRRLGHGWDRLALAVVVGHFALPFMLLLWRRVKSSQIGLAVVCAILLVAHLLDAWWLVLPDLIPSAGLGWGAPAAVVAIGGAALAFGIWREGRIASGGHLAAEAGHG
jgi:hypothetical protein